MYSIRSSHFSVLFLKNTAYYYSQPLNVLSFIYWFGGHLLSTYKVPGTVLVSMVIKVGRKIKSIPLHHGLKVFRKIQGSRLTVKDMVETDEASMGSK